MEPCYECIFSGDVDWLLLTTDWASAWPDNDSTPQGPLHINDPGRKHLTCRPPHHPFSPIPQTFAPCFSSSTNAFAMSAAAPSMTATSAQPAAAVQMKVMSGGETAKQSPQCIAGENRAARIRGGGAAKDCFVGLFACFVCFECCEGCCECIADIICCPCEMCC